MFKFLKWRRFYRYVLNSHIGLSGLQLKTVLMEIKANRIVNKEELILVMREKMKQYMKAGTKMANFMVKVYSSAQDVIKVKLPEMK